MIVIANNILSQSLKILKVAQQHKNSWLAKCLIVKKGACTITNTVANPKEATHP